jgi:hypothetical protein
MRMVRCQAGPNSPVPEVVPETDEEVMFHLADLTASSLPYIVDGNEISEARWLI